MGSQARRATPEWQRLLAIVNGDDGDRAVGPFKGGGVKGWLDAHVGLQTQLRLRLVGVAIGARGRGRAYGEGGGEATLVHAH